MWDLECLACLSWLIILYFTSFFLLCWSGYWFNCGDSLCLEVESYLIRSYDTSLLSYCSFFVVFFFFFLVTFGGKSLYFLDTKSFTKFWPCYMSMDRICSSFILLMGFIYSFLYVFGWICSPLLTENEIYGLTSCSWTTSSS